MVTSLSVSDSGSGRARRHSSRCRRRCETAVDGSLGDDDAALLPVDGPRRSPTTDTQVEHGSLVAGLSASGSRGVSVELTAPSNGLERTTTVRAWTRLTDESDTTNNCSASVQVMVPESKCPGLDAGVTDGKR